MEPKKIKTGVVGVGALGQHHARIYGELDGAELVGVYDASAKRAAEIAKKCGCRTFATIEELAENVEAASIAVPTDIHREVAGLMIPKGVHLLVEKPITSTTQEAEELVALAQQHGTVLQVGHIERFNPVMDFLEQKALKTPPLFIEAHRLAPYPPKRPGAPPRGTEVSVVLDLMIHDIEIILHLVKSPVTEVRAVGVPVLSSTEDICNVRLEFENGCVANITTSRLSPKRMRKIRVFTSDSYLSLNYEKQNGRIYTQGGLAGITYKRVPVEKGDQLTRELNSFLRCVETKDEPAVSGQQASDALKLAMEIIQLSQQRLKKER